MARDKNLYGIGSLARFVDAENFGLLLDNINAKYNQAVWKKYAAWGTPTDDREWKQGTKETPILVRASVLGTNSPKPQRNTQGWGMYSGTLPKIGHGFSIDQDDFIELRKVAKLSNLTFGESLVDSFVYNASKMLGGIHAELNYMTMQAMSTGQINDVPVDGVAYDFKFPIPEQNIMGVTEMWYVWKTVDGVRKLVPNDKADVIQDLMDLQEYYTDTLNLGLDHWKVSKKLLRMILNHPSVKAAFLASKYGNNYMNIHIENDETTISYDPKIKVVRSEILAWMYNEIAIWPFEEIDYKSRHEEDGKPVADAPAFDEHNLVASTRAFRPFEMKCMRSILQDRMGWQGQTGADLYSLVEGRIVVLNSWEERPNLRNTVDCELFAGPVFNNVREHGIVTVWKEDDGGSSSSSSSSSSE